MTNDKPIVTSRLQKDWYYVTMGYFAWSRHRDVQVRWGFKNRSKGIVLGERVDEGRLREEIEHVSHLAYTAEEIGWLREKFGVGAPNGFLPDEYLGYLQTNWLSAIDIEKVQTPDGPSYRIEPHGAWCDGMDWETFVLPILTKLNGEWVMRQHGVSERALWAEAGRRLGRKIELLRRYPDLSFGEFGLRRQFSYELSRFIDETLIREIPGQLSGISHVWMAKELDWPVVGTFAHQGPMVYSGIHWGIQAEIRASHMKFMDDWMATFGPRWSTAVLDTYGSKAFYEDFGAARAAAWNVYKVDSGNPFHEGEQLETYLRAHGVDPRTKVLNPTDGLDVDSIIALHLTFRNRFKAMKPGWGTTLSNDTGLPTFGSFVVKATEANGHPLVKLSNNLDKASGDPKTVAHFKRVFGYANTERQTCVV